jgi:hypothetical protein
MPYFQTKNPNFDVFWKALQWKILLYILAIWYTLRAFGIFCDFGIFFQVLVCCAKKNLAALLVSRITRYVLPRWRHCLELLTLFFGRFLSLNFDQMSSTLALDVYALKFTSKISSNSQQFVFDESRRQFRHRCFDFKNIYAETFLRN